MNAREIIVSPYKKNTANTSPKLLIIILKWIEIKITKQLENK